MLFALRQYRTRPGTRAEFDDDTHGTELDAAVYESDRWKNEIAPRIPELTIREEISVTRLMPTQISVIR